MLQNEGYTYKKVLKLKSLKESMPREELLINITFAVYICFVSIKRAQSKCNLLSLSLKTFNDLKFNLIRGTFCGSFLKYAYFT